MAEKKFIAFLDILGFKDLVLNNSHLRLVDLYEKIFSLGIQISLAGGKINIVDQKGKKTAIPALEKSMVNSLIISDSVLLWTDDSSMKSFVDLIIVVRYLLHRSILSGFPLRGAIVEGELSILRKEFSLKTSNTQLTFIGKGLVDAYMLENKQEWAGCIVDENCIKIYNEYVEKYKNDYSDLADIDYLIRRNLLIKYEVPYKKGPIKNEYVINWPKIGTRQISERQIKNAFGKYDKSIGSWDVKRKINNTIEFIRSTNKR